MSIHDFKSASAFLGKKPHRPLSGRSTRLVRLESGDIAVRFHETAVVTYRKDGTIKLATGGWKTMTTKERINEYSGAGLYAKNGIWYFRDGSLFRDGTVLDAKGRPQHPAGAAVTKAAEDAKRELDREVAAYIKGFCAKVVEDKALPEPSGGDCLGCQLRLPNAQTEEPMGYSHYRDHLRDHYYMGSLIVNALRVAGYRDPQFIGWRMNEDAKRGDTGLLRHVLTRFFREIKSHLLSA